MANAPAYDAATARADKLLEPDGSVKTQAGTTVLGPDAGRAATYSQASWRADKWLEPNGSVVTAGGSGTSTPPGGASGQIQYNSSGAFAGAAGLQTDGNNLGIGAAPTVPLTIVDTSGDVNTVLIQPTWNSAATVFTALKANVTNTASNGNSLLLDLQVGGASKVNMRIDGTTNVSKLSTTYLSIDNLGGYIQAINTNGTVSVIGGNAGASGAGAEINLNGPTVGTNPGCFQIRTGTTGAHGANPIALFISASQQVGIGTTAPKSPLHVVGIPIYANNAAAITGGLTAGALYRTGSDPDQLCIVH